MPNRRRRRAAQLVALMIAIAIATAVPANSGDAAIVPIGSSSAYATEPPVSSLLAAGPLIAVGCVDAFYGAPRVIPLYTGPDAREYIVNVANDAPGLVLRDGKDVGGFASGGDYISATQSLIVRFVKARSDTEGVGSSDGPLGCRADVGGGGPDIPESDNVLLRMSAGTTYSRTV